MLPTIDRAPRRSRYSSATRYPAAGFLRRRMAALLAGCPDASISATRVSPRSTLTSTCFRTKWSLLNGQSATLGPCGHPCLDVDGLQDADRHQRDDHRGPAVAHERQGHSGDGHDADGHSDVDEDPEHEHRDDAAGDQCAVEVL